MLKDIPSVETIFAGALEIKLGDQRRAYLAEACGEDADLRKRVEKLLEADAKAGSFLASPVAAAELTLAAPVLTEGPGMVIGRYKLLEQLGEGGFGIVFMAEQEEPVRRKVALKIIKPGMDTKEVIARFEAEEQALALMDHPNIARVFDAGTTDSGRPYFVMELVRGKPITDYCDQCDLSPQERLELFVSVCQAVQHAHQKGIIHRDIKPSNVLVTLHDGEPVVKVIDFGVAKAINQRLTEKTLFTRFAQMVGTPLYMSPEQAEMSGLDVDTRTDIYSLGVLLYELLTGTTPFDKRRLLAAGYDEIRRIIREEEPVKPSTKISTLGDGDATATSHRKIDRKRMSALLRGDLDWIVMKALEKDRRRRYETAKDFAADVVRYLNHKPVEASPPSMAYRVRKFVRRNRTGVGVGIAAALVFILLGGAGWYATVQRLGKDLSDQKAAAAALTVEVTGLKAEKAEAEAKRLKRQRDEAEKRQKALERRAVALPDLEQLKNEQRWAEAFKIAEGLRQEFPTDREVLQLWHEVSSTWTAVTEPPGATLSCRPYGTRNDWTRLGTSPLDEVAVPRGFYHWKIEKDGFHHVEGCSGDQDVKLQTTLEPTTSLTGRMVHVTVSLTDREADFYIDRYETTNRQFKRFVDAGGYAKKDYWKEPFLDDGKPLSWEAAISRFVDSTGKPGPSTWKDGTYPAAEDDYPVRGVSWYEAAAYAEFLGLSLPTMHDWQLASGARYSARVTVESNCENDHVAKVGAYQGVGPFGTYDMAGNVKEWCWNKGVGGQRYILGGAWYEPEYMFTCRDVRPPMDRSDSNGFRCLRYVRQPTEQLLADVLATYRDYMREKPVSDTEFASIKSRYAYDAAPLNAAVTQSNPYEQYRHEVVEFDAAYVPERVTAHLFLPGKLPPPYQTVVYFPTGDAQDKPVFPEKPVEQFGLIAAIVNSGRAFLWPVYWGTYERGGGTRPKGKEGYINQHIRQIQDLRRSMDYLAERPDIDLGKTAYLGRSWGSLMGPACLALEDRIHAAVLLNGGLPTHALYSRETDPFTFASRVVLPTRMINGKGDNLFPFDTSQLPLLNSLGTTEAHKDHRVVEGQGGYGHGGVPTEVLARETIDWLDRYFGAADSEAIAADDPKKQLQFQMAQAERYVSTKRYGEAEKICRSILETQGADADLNQPDFLKLAFQLAAAVAGQQRPEDAAKLYQDTLERQRRLLGAEHEDTRATAKSYSNWLVRDAWDIVLSAARSPKDYERAESFGRRAAEIDPTLGAWVPVAYAQYRQGNAQGSLESLRKSLANGESGIVQWFLFALVHHRAGDAETARDWFYAASEWVEKTRSTGPIVAAIRSQAAYLLELPSEWPQQQWHHSEAVELYSRLIVQYPEAGRLHHCRGSHFGRAREWQKAGSDYAKAAELSPTNAQHSEAHAAACLALGDTAAYDAVCCDAFVRFQGSEVLNFRTTWVLMGSLGQSLPIDPAELKRTAEAVLAHPAAPKQQRPYYTLAHGMALYRADSWEQALETLPTSDFLNPKDEILAILFRAMAHAKLGDSYTSRKLLDKGREEIQTQVAPLDGPELPYQDRPVVWCMVQTALREAEALIEGGASAAVKTASAAAVP
ncbi:MAG: protein kinase [Rhodopirellula sp.]|nr:protein kinase [Rhodopirellula sp.]